MKNFLLGLAVVFCLSPLALAHPPSQIELSFNTQTLHIVISHVTSNILKHHIRKVIVYQNDKEVWSQTFPSQTSPTELIGDVTISAKPKDIIRVKAVCSEAGSGEQTLVIPDEKVKPSKTP